MPVFCSSQPHRPRGGGNTPKVTKCGHAPGVRAELDYPLRARLDHPDGPASLAARQFTDFFGPDFAVNYISPRDRH